MCPTMKHCDVVANPLVSYRVLNRIAVPRINYSYSSMQSSRFLFSSGIQRNADVVALSLPRVAQNCCVSQITMATGRWWLLLLLSLLMLMESLAVPETDPPGYGMSTTKPPRKHPNTTYTIITEICFLKIFKSIFFTKGRPYNRHINDVYHRRWSHEGLQVRTLTIIWL